MNASLFHIKYTKKSLKPYYIRKIYSKLGGKVNGIIQFEQYGSQLSMTNNRRNKLHKNKIMTVDSA